MLLARASYPYTWNQRRASHARALRGTAASIPNPAQLRSLRSGLGPVCARGYLARGKSTARARKVGNAKRRVPSESTAVLSIPSLTACLGAE
jgi:hypothetical protein